MFEKRVLLAGGRSHDVSIHVERRNSVRVSLTGKGVIIRAPRHLNRFEREKEIMAMLEWAKKRLQQDPEFSFTKKEYVHGDFLKTNSRIYQLEIEIRDSTKNFSKIQGSKIIFKIAAKHAPKKRQEYISKQLRKLLAVHHHADLVSLVNTINARYFNKDINKISYKYTTSRWGACRIEDKEINLSTKLLLAPLPVLEYVIIHELAHLIEANHSKRFWNIVKSVDPSYKEKVRWLKNHGHTLQI